MTEPTDSERELTELWQRMIVNGAMKRMVAKGACEERDHVRYHTYVHTYIDTCTVHEILIWRKEKRHNPYTTCLYNACIRFSYCKKVR
jgi:hypothetical protein